LGLQIVAGFRPIAAAKPPLHCHCDKTMAGALSGAPTDRDGYNLKLFFYTRPTSLAATQLWRRQSSRTHDSISRIVNDT